MVGSEVELLFELGSIVFEVTLALFVIVPVVVDFTVMITLILALLLIFPRLHVTIAFDSLQLPWLELADLKVTPVGKLSVTTIFSAVFGPLLFTVIV